MHAMIMINLLFLFPDAEVILPLEGEGRTISNHVRQFIVHNCSMLRSSDDSSVAILAEWECIKKLAGNDAIGKEALRFGGLISGAIKCPVPKWWVKVLAQAYVQENGLTNFQWPKHAPSRLWNTHSSGLLYNGFDGVSVLNDGLVLLKDGETISVQATLLDELQPWNEINKNIGIHGEISKGKLLFAFHAVPHISGSTNSLTLIDTQKNRVLWRSSLPTQRISIGGNATGSFAQTASTENTYYVFGGNEYEAYIFGVSRECGKVVFVFSTAFGEQQIR